VTSSTGRPRTTLSLTCPATPSLGVCITPLHARSRLSLPLSAPHSCSPFLPCLSCGLCPTRLTTTYVCLVVAVPPHPTQDIGTLIHANRIALQSIMSEHHEIAIVLDALDHHVLVHAYVLDVAPGASLVGLCQVDWTDRVMRWAYSHVEFHLHSRV
jgi:hypothetical protein